MDDTERRICKNCKKFYFRSKHNDKEGNPRVYGVQTCELPPTAAEENSPCTTDKFKKKELKPTS